MFLVFLTALMFYSREKKMLDKCRTQVGNKRACRQTTVTDWEGGK